MIPSKNDNPDGINAVTVCGDEFTAVTLNPDNNVTFRYRNPKAVTVEVSGEFMEGAAPLREVDGVWTYHFIIGGEIGRTSIRRFLGRVLASRIQYPIQL